MTWQSTYKCSENERDINNDENTGLNLVHSFDPFILFFFKSGLDKISKRGGGV